MAEMIRAAWQRLFGPRIDNPTHRRHNAASRHATAVRYVNNALPPDFEDRIRERAYFLWRDDGCPTGRDIHDWTRAEELVRADLVLQPANHREAD